MSGLIILRQPYIHCPVFSHQDDLWMYCNVPKHSHTWQIKCTKVQDLFQTLVGTFWVFTYEDDILELLYAVWEYDMKRCLNCYLAIQSDSVVLFVR